MSNLLSPESESANASQFLTRFAVDDLRIGAMLYSPIFDPVDEPPKLLLAAGTTLSDSLISQLRQRGFDQVRVSQEELSNLAKINGPNINSEIEEKLSKHLKNDQNRVSTSAFQQRAPGSRWGATEDSFIHKIETFGAEQYDPILASHYKREFSQNLKKSEKLFRAVSQNLVQNSELSNELIHNAFNPIINDIDLFLSTNLISKKYTGPAKHGYQTSMLAMSMGTILGLSKAEITELGLGCLLHEVGAMRLNPKLTYSAQPLSRLEQLELTKHPGYTMDILTRWSDFPGSSCLIAYQMHERCNGSGYPNGRMGAQIHYLAKVAAVADTYVNLMAKRQDTTTELLPYHAIEQILYQVRSGGFDRDVVRSLLYTVSIFPIGSLVETSDYRVGQVIRSNRENYLKPVCELWWRDDPVNTREIVDLNENPELFVLRPLNEVPQPILPEDGKLDHPPLPLEATPSNDELIGSSTKSSTTQPFIDEEISSILDDLDFNI